MTPINWANWPGLENRAAFVRWAEPPPDGSSAARYAIEVDDSGRYIWVSHSPSPDVASRRSQGCFYGASPEEAIEAAVRGAMKHKSNVADLVGGTK